LWLSGGSVTAVPLWEVEIILYFTNLTLGIELCVVTYEAQVTESWCVTILSGVEGMCLHVNSRIITISGLEEMVSLSTFEVSLYS
jgi:hypothetical protein